MNNERVLYRIEEGRMGIDTPASIFHRVASSGFGSSLYTLLKREAPWASVDTENDTYQLRFDTKRIGDIEDEWAMDAQLNTVVRVFNEFDRTGGELGASDPNLTFSLGTERTYYGRPGHFELARPDITDARLRDVANVAMRSVGSDLGVQYKGFSLQDMHTEVSLEGGIEFIFDNLASAGIATDSARHVPDNEVIELRAHNLHTPTMQLVCFSGILAVLEEQRRMAGQVR